MSIYWELQGNYGYGWDALTAENSLAEIKARLTEYRANDREALAFRIKKIREAN